MTENTKVCIYFAEKMPVFPQKAASLSAKAGILAPQSWHINVSKQASSGAKGTHFEA